ncbi:hypothetical protein HK100_003364 [Physocladia obscura]|uniref:Uncharacterized protein n=1 Tax=Physocladia obscura TaxID=109957 RepID=A0AAD5XAI3_9FUNG|nr:hypothetical protein HK100_003364 [Physocladia obscura]
MASLDEAIHKFELTVSRKGLGNAVRVANIVVYVLLVLTAIFWFIEGERANHVLAVYYILLTFALIAVDIVAPIGRVLPFLLSYGGRGFVNIVVGVPMLVVPGSGYRYNSFAGPLRVFGCVTLIIGLLFSFVSLQKLVVFPRPEDLAVDLAFLLDAQRLRDNVSLNPAGVSLDIANEDNEEI